MSEIRISIAGVTGKLAKLFAVELLKYPNVTIHGICRNPTKLLPELSSNPRMKIFQADCHESEKIQDAVKGTQVCICGYMGDNTVLVDGQKVLIDACIAEKVPRYIASDFSFDFRGFKLGDIPHMDFHFLVGAYLKDKEEQKLIKSAHILNGAFMEVFVNPFFGAYDSQTKTFHTWGTGKEIFELTTYGDTAKFTAAVAMDQNANGFRALFGDHKNAEEVAAAYESVYGQKLNVKVEGSLKTLINDAQSMMRQQPQDFFLWVPKMLNYYMLNGSTLVKNVDEQKLKAVQPITLEEFFKRTKLESLPTLVGI